MKKHAKRAPRLSTQRTPGIANIPRPIPAEMMLNERERAILTHALLHGHLRRYGTIPSEAETAQLLTWAALTRTHAGVLESILDGWLAVTIRLDGEIEYVVHDDAVETV